MSERSSSTGERGMSGGQGPRTGGGTPARPGGSRSSHRRAASRGPEAEQAAQAIPRAGGSGIRPTRRPTRAQQIHQARTRRRALIFGGVPLVLVVIVVAILIASNSTSSSGLVNANDLNPGSKLLSVGTKAPNFTLKTVDGKSYSLSSLKGKPVLLEFFAVWCPHCQRESTVINQLDTNLGPKGLQTLAVLASPYGRNYDTSGGNDLSIVTKGDVQWFEKTFAVQHPTLIDPTFATVNTYNATSYPTLYVVDRQGVIRYANSGEQPYANLAAPINAALK